MELWSLRLLSRILGAFNRICIRKDGTVNRKLEKWMCSQVPARAKPVHGVSTVDVVVDFNKNLWVRLFIPNKVLHTQAQPCHSLMEKADACIEAICYRVGDQ